MDRPEDAGVMLGKLVASKAVFPACLPPGWDFDRVRAAVAALRTDGYVVVEAVTLLGQQPYWILNRNASPALAGAAPGGVK